MDKNTIRTQTYLDLDGDRQKEIAKYQISMEQKGNVVDVSVATIEQQIRLTLTLTGLAKISASPPSSASARSAQAQVQGAQFGALVLLLFV